MFTKKVLVFVLLALGGNILQGMDNPAPADHEVIDDIAKSYIEGCQWKALALLLNGRANPQPIINHLLSVPQEHLDRTTAHNNSLITLSNLGNSLFAELLLQSVPTSANANPGSRRALKSLIKVRKIRPFKSLGKHYLNCNNWTAHEREHRQELINIVNELKQEAGFWGDILYPKLEINNHNKIVPTTSYKVWVLGGSIIALVAAGVWWLTKKAESDNVDDQESAIEQENNPEPQIDGGSHDLT